MLKAIWTFILKLLGLYKNRYGSAIYGNGTYN